MLSLPKKYELIGFFEAEPELTDGEGTPWEYLELRFATTRGKDSLVVDIYAPSGTFSVEWKNADKTLLQLKLIGLDKLTVEMQKQNEFLVATGEFLDHTVLLKLCLKPEVSIEFEQLIIP